jgi:hypothetical protein
VKDRAPHPTPKKQRGRARKAAPFVSQRPWAGFTAHDNPRDEPLSLCPAARCRRAKQCIAALDNLYCLRTHHSLAELQALRRNSALQRELDAVPEVLDGDDLTARMERIAELAEIRRAHEQEILARWKAGALDDRHGKYRPGGVLLRPPPRRYVDERKPKGA